MDITTIVIIIAAICGVAYFVPQLPSMARLIAVVIIVIACIIVLLRFAGVPIGL